MDFFTRLNLLKLNEIIIHTQSRLFLSLPAIPEITSKAILKLNKERQNVEINILIDFDPQTFRQGYGEIEAFEALYDSDVKLINFPDNRISFIISDNVGYYLFFDSQYLVPAEKESLNAIKIDNVSLVKLKQYYFNQTSALDFTDDLTNAIIEDSKILNQLDESKELPKPAATLQISEKEKSQVKEDLEKKPPLKPIHKRLLDIYSNKFQYVDLRFNGAKIKNVEVPVPNNLLPVKNEKLKEQLKTKIKVFENPEKIKELEELKKLENHLKIIRKNYLFHSKVCLKSILSIHRKQCFEKKIKVIEKKIPKLTDCLLEALYNEQEKTQNRFMREVEELIIKEPTLVFDEKSPWIKDPKKIKIAAQNRAIHIKTNMRWPDYFKLLEKMTIKTFYSDITVEDLRNKELLKELKKNKIISEEDANQLSEFRKGMEVVEKKNLDANQRKLFY